MRSTPHDALFKAIFCHPEHARPVLRALLPPALMQHLRFETLRLVSGSFVDPQLWSANRFAFGREIADLRRITALLLSCW